MSRRSYMAQSAARRPGAGPHAPAKHLRGRGAGWLADWEAEQEDRVNILEPATSETTMDHTKLMTLISLTNGTALREALRAYEETGDHDHGRGVILPGGRCNGFAGDECWVAKAREVLAGPEEQRPTLGWIRNLPEVGTLRNMADEEAALLAQLAMEERAVVNRRREIQKYREYAEVRVARDYTAEEIAAAKAAR